MRRAWTLPVLVLLAGCAAAGKNKLRPDDHLPADYAIACDGAYEHPPKLLAGKSPIFPASTFSPYFIEERKIRHQPLHWQVITRFDVLADGSTARIRSNETEPAYFATHSNAAIRDWRFEPASKDGAAVVSSCVHELRFELDG